jgi:cytosolic iron-sulfur protein assembly protein CIAO1
MYTYTQNRNFSLLNSTSTGHAKTVRAVAWSPSGTSLATGSFDSNVAIWEQTEDLDGEWECVGTLEGHDTECKSVAFSSSGNFLASCSRDKSVWIWEGLYLVFSCFSRILRSSVLPDDYNCESVQLEHEHDVKCVSWHPKEEVSL